MPAIDVAIFVVGVLAAAVSGIVAYRIVGPYGDGPLNVGLYRTTDPETGKLLVYRETRTADGKVLRVLYDDATRSLQEVRVALDVAGRPAYVGLHFDAKKNLTRLDRDHDLDGRADVSDYYDDPKGFVKVGFSLAGNGVIDAWSYQDAKGEVQKVEVSTRQDGVVDRWEYYEKGQLARVEEDRDHDGRVDHRLTYDAGILMNEAEVRNGERR